MLVQWSLWTIFSDSLDYEECLSSACVVDALYCVSTLLRYKQGAFSLAFRSFGRGYSIWFLKPCGLRRDESPFHEVWRNGFSRSAFGWRRMGFARLGAGEAIWITFEGGGFRRLRLVLGQLPAGRLLDLWRLGVFWGLFSGLVLARKLGRFGRKWGVCVELGLLLLLWLLL